MSAHTARTNVLIAGGGVAALETALALQAPTDENVASSYLHRSLPSGTGRPPSPSLSGRRCTSNLATSFSGVLGVTVITFRVITFDTFMTASLPFARLRCERLRPRPHAQRPVRPPC